MKYNKIHNSDLVVSDICFGTWGISGDWGLKYNKEYVSKILKYAIKCGINFFDTAIVYGNGFCEKLLGKINEDIVILTKIPAVKKPIGDKCNINNYYSKKRIIYYLKQSLKNLNKKSIDILLLHNWHYSWKEESNDILSYLNKIKEEGLAKLIGISLPDWFCNDIDYIIENKLIDCVEVPINLLQKWAIELIVPKAKKEHIYVFARSPLARGLLTGMRPEELSLNDLRKDYFVVAYKKGLFKTLEGLCTNLKIPISELPTYAISYCRSIDGVTSTIVGMSNIRTINRNIVL